MGNLRRLLYLIVTTFALQVTHGQSFITTWKTDNTGTSANNQITIPTTGFGYNYDIDWGDGMIDTGVDGNITHTYGSIGTYTVSISGTFPQIIFNNGLDKDKILTIEQWGDNAWTSMQNAFYGCSNLTHNAADTPDLSGVTDLSYMFSGCIFLNSDLSSWDVSTVSNMAAMFNRAFIFNQPLNAWNVSSVTDMSEMFDGAFVFNQSLSNWDVSAVTNMSAMFSLTVDFDQPLNAWNVSSVTNMYDMFSETVAFNQPLSNWNVSAVNNMGSMFEDAAAFNQPLSSWDVSNVTDMELMFFNTTVFNGSVDAWNVSSVTDMHFMFELAREFNQPLASWDMTAVTDMREMFTGATAFNQPLDNWDVSNVLNMEYLFNSTEAFNQPLPSWDVSGVLNMNNMFGFAIAFDQPLSTWDVSSVTDMTEMFRNATAFNQSLNTWNVSSVIAMTEMFRNANVFDQSLADWDISAVINMVGMFNNSGMSVTSYDATLIGWEDDNGGTETIPIGITLGAAGLNYCAGASAWNSLGTTYSWTITDAGLNCPFPNAPTNLFTAEISANQIDLTWVDNSTDETGFTIERSNRNNDFTVPDMTFATAVDATAFSDVTVTAENGYYYRIIANGSFGNSNPSKEKFGSTKTPPGNALDFDGVNDYVDISLLNQIFAGGENNFAVEMWVNLAPIYTGSNYGALFAINDISGSGNVNHLVFFVSKKDDGQSNSIVVGDNDVNPIGSVYELEGPVIADNTWHHVAYSRSGTVGTLFVDGTIVDTHTADFVLDADDAWSIGQEYDGGASLGNFINGQMDEIRVWSTPRSMSEIDNNMFSVLSGSESGLEAYYRFDQGTNGIVNTGISTLPDRSQNQNDGTLTNFDLGVANVSNSNWISSDAQKPIVYSAGTVTTSGFIANWKPVPFASNILIQVDDDPSFVSPIVDDLSVSTGGASLVAATLTKGTRYYYRLKAVSGTTTPYSNARLFMVAPGNALDFDGSNDHINLGDPSELMISGDLSLEAWVNWDGISGQSQIITSRGAFGDNATANILYQLGMDADGKLFFFFEHDAGTNSIDLKSNAVMPAGEWIHVAAVRDATAMTITLYLNGVSLDMAQTTYPTNANGGGGVSQRVMIGDRNGSGGAYFDGIIDEVRIWNSVRTQSELRANMAVSVKRDEPNLAAYYNFDQGVASGDNSSPAVDVILDVGLNAHDGLLSGFLLNGISSNWVVSGAFIPFDPTNLFATEISATQIDLSWADNAFNETGYTIERSDGNLDFTVPDMTFSVAADATTFSDVNVIAENVYYYRVIANGTHGNSKPSNEKFGSTITPPGNALDFDGVNDYVKVADDVSLDFGTGDFTVEYWFNKKANASAWSNVYGVSKWNNAGGNPGANEWLLNVGTNVNVDIPAFVIESGTNLYGVAATSTISLNQWYHVAGVREGSEMRIYINGILENTLSTGSIVSINNVGRDLNIGRNDLNTFFFTNALFDEIRIWDVARTETEIQTEMSSTLVGDESNLVTYYRFDQGIANGDNTTPPIDRLPDRSQNQNNGILNGFTLNGNQSNWVVSRYLLLPVISIYQGTDNTGSSIINTQTAVIDFGSATLSNDITLTFAIENTGTADLNISEISTGGMDFGVSSIPTTIAIGTTETFAVTLSGATEGVFNDLVTITSDDANEGSFTFPIRGVINVAPVVFNGEDNTGLVVLTNQQINIGSTSLNIDIDKVFVIENLSTINDLVITGITSDNNVFEIFNAPTLVVPQSFEPFTVRLLARTLGTPSANVSVATNVGDFSFQVFGEIVENNLTIDDLNIYNVVSPNGDGVHDFFKIGNIESFINNTVSIYNRWGDKVFELRDYDNVGNVFNGTANMGSISELDSGNYFYAIDSGDGSKRATGYLFLKR